MAKPVKPKRKCCQDRPRCKRCAVVLNRLTKQGLAEPAGGGRVQLSPALTKKALKAARAR